MYKRLPKDISEHAIQTQTIKVLEMAKYIVFRANVTTDIYHIASLPKGFPDIFGYVPSSGRIFFLEMKTKTGSIRPDQIEFHEKLQKDNIIHGIARSPEDAIKIVRQGLVGYGYSQKTSKKHLKK